MAASGGLFGWMRSPAPVPVPVERLETFSESLPSYVPEAHFDASVSLRWIDDGRGSAVADPAGVARRYVRTFVVTALSRASVTKTDEIQQSINERLLRSVRVDGSRVCVTWAAVSLAVSPNAIETVTRHEAMRRARTERELRQQAELDDLRYLRDNILSDPAMARSYWFKHHPESLEALLGPQFENVATRMGATASTLAIAELIDKFLVGLRPEDRDYLLQRVGDVFSSFGHTELAQELDGHRPAIGVARFEG